MEYVAVKYVMTTGYCHTFRIVMGFAWINIPTDVSQGPTSTNGEWGLCGSRPVIWPSPFFLLNYQSSCMGETVFTLSWYKGTAPPLFLFPYFPFLFQSRRHCVFSCLLSLHHFQHAFLPLSFEGFWFVSTIISLCATGTSHRLIIYYLTCTYYRFSDTIILYFLSSYSHQIFAQHHPPHPKLG